jgi:hypothetical protein
MFSVLYLTQLLSSHFYFCLQPDDDFAAFGALARSVPSLEVRVTVNGEGPSMAAVCFYLYLLIHFHFFSPKY